MKIKNYCDSFPEVMIVRTKMGLGCWIGVLF